MVALAHGTSDGQKTMGVITLVLIAANLQASGTGPQMWVIIISALAIGLGTYSGGWRIMRAMGKGIVEIETPQGAASGAATSATILASAHFGFGLSTTHVSTGSILGSGVGRGAEVRWSVARRMVFAWLLTLPGAALVGGLAALLADQGVWGISALLVLLAGDLPGDLLPLSSPQDHPRQCHRQPRSPGAGCRCTHHRTPARRCLKLLPSPRRRSSGPN